MGRERGREWVRVVELWRNGRERKNTAVERGGDLGSWGKKASLGAEKRCPRYQLREIRKKGQGRYDCHESFDVIQSYTVSFFVPWFCFTDCLITCLVSLSLFGSSAYLWHVFLSVWDYCAFVSTIIPLTLSPHATSPMHVSIDCQDLCFMPPKVVMHASKATQAPSNGHC